MPVGAKASGAGARRGGPALAIAATLVGLAACSQRSGSSRAAGDAASAGSASSGDADAGVALAVAPAPPQRPLGLETAAAFGYSRGPGEAAYRRAARAAAAGRWPAVEKAARQALAADPRHLAARWLLGEALAARGENAGALESLLAAVAGDPADFGFRDLAGDHLAGFITSGAGERWRRELDAYRRRYQAALAAAVPFVARLDAAGSPGAGQGKAAWPGGALVARDLESGRVLRLAGDGDIAGALVSPSGGAIAYARTDRVEVDTPSAGGDAGAATPLLGAVRVGVFDRASGRVLGEVELAAGAAALDLFWSGGRPRLFAQRRAAGGAGQALALEPSERRTRKVRSAPRPRSPLLRLTPGDQRLLWPRPVGVAADWDQRGAADVLRLRRSRQTATLPRGQLALRDRLRWSPGDNRLVVAAEPEHPCAAGATTSLFVVEAATGRVRGLMGARGPLEARWLDEERVVTISGGERRFRVVEVESGETVASWPASGGDGLDALGHPQCPGS